MRRLVLAGTLGLLLLSTSTAFAATSNAVWHTTLKTGAVRGGATLAELANGKAASLAVKLFEVKPATTVTVTLYDGANGTGSVIVSKDRFKAPASGPATHRFWLTKPQLATLKADVAKKDTLSVVVTATGAPSGPTVTLTGNLAAVK